MNFHSVHVISFVPEYSDVYWMLESGITSDEPIYFYIDYSRSGFEWEPLNENNPVVNGCHYRDTVRHYWGKQLDWYYRVRAVINGVTVAESCPVSACGNWNAHDWLIARDIVRKELLVCHKYSGTKGWLLKQRRWGTRCSSCLDWDTGTRSNMQCPVCYGTGFVGGYYDALSACMVLSNTSREDVTNVNIGVNDNITIVGRMIAYPYLDTGDIWIDSNSGKRYIIGKITNVAEMRGIPLVVQCVLRLAPASDVVYDVPIKTASSSSSQTTSSSSSSSTALSSSSMKSSSSSLSSSVGVKQDRQVGQVH